MVDQIDAPGGSARGWLSALDISSRDAGDSALTVTKFEDRDLSSELKTSPSPLIMVA